MLTDENENKQHYRIRMAAMFSKTTKTAEKYDSDENKNKDRGFVIKNNYE